MTRASGHRFSEEAPGGGVLARLYTRTSLTLLGLLTIAIIVGLLAVTIGVFTHSFSDPAHVSLQLDRAGNQLSKGADVKLNGIIVGRVDGISASDDGSGATLRLAIDRHYLSIIPANVTAQVLPKTLFGEKYVDLGLPPAPATARLADGASIERDHSSVAIETSTVLNDLQPLLDAVDPADLDRTLTAVATALDGRGAQLGQTIHAAAAFTDLVRPTVPQLVADAGLLGTVADSYDRASGPLLRSLKQVGVTARTLTAKQQQLITLLSSSSQFARATAGFVDQVGPTALQVVQVSQPVLQLLAKYSPEIACLLTGVSQAKDRLEAVFADGPYLKARLYVAVSRGMYQYGVDSPTSLDLSAYGPNCPITPKNGKGTVPWPMIPKELDELRGKPQLLKTLDGPQDLSGLNLSGLLGSTPPRASTGSATGTDVSKPSDLLGLLLGGVLG